VDTGESWIKAKFSVCNQHTETAILWTHSGNCRHWERPHPRNNIYRSIKKRTTQNIMIG